MAGMKGVVTGFSGVATSAFALYNAYDRVQDMTVSVDRILSQLKDQERDLMRKIILEMVDKGHVGLCHPFATDTTFAAQMRYLLDVGMIRRESRGIYRITEKGEQYLEIMY
jgi:hypothetical protein